MKVPQVLIPVAHGSESLETVTLVNVLRRAKISVLLASIERGKTVTGTRDIPLVADTLFKDVARKKFDAIILPGGEKGAAAFAKHAALMEKVAAQRMAHKWYGGICAAPALALSPHGLLDGKQATCFPAFRDRLIHYVNQPVVVDGHCITSQGPATAIAFALKLVELLAGEARRREVAQALLAA
ncbi:MAG: DJ-1 family glyoxalase III [Stenotrophobium sp.]